VPKPSKTRRWYVYRNFKQREKFALYCYAGGLGSFEPRKPLIEDIEFYEDKGISISSKSRKFRDKSSNRWRWRFGFRLSIFLSNVASEVTLIHRRNEFRGALDL
jgi:thioredoxin reductase (NADPH)